MPLVLLNVNNYYCFIISLKQKNMHEQKVWYKAGLHHWYLQCCHYCNTCSALMPRVLSEKFLMNDKTYNIIIGFGFVRYEELVRSQRVISRGRRGSRINTDWFPKRVPKAQASRGSSGRLPQGSFWIFNSFKSSFLHRFPSHLDGILARVHFGKCFI